MQWASVGEFLAMGGHGLYVWGSFGACLLLMVAEPILISRRQSAVRETLRREQLAEALDTEPDKSPS